jgi:hypothetical protein
VESNIVTHGNNAQHHAAQQPDTLWAQADHSVRLALNAELFVFA